MKAFRRLALWTTAATYFLVFAGGLVRVSGAGLGCPDWPKCFGRWIPPTSLSQLPPGIDPSAFNVTLAWIEYFNRLAGMTVGLLILGVAILAIRHFRKNPRVLYPSLAAALLVAYQGWQGSNVVASGLEPFIVTIHMVTALVIASLMIYATVESYSASDSGASAPPDFPGYTRRLMVGLWVATVVQIIFGSQVRQGLEVAARQLPQSTPQEWFARVGTLKDLHLMLGVLVALLTLYEGMAVLRSEGGRQPIVRQTIWAMLLLVFLQAGLGLVLLVTGLPAVTDLFHLWFAALYVGLLLVLLTVVRRPRALVAQWERGSTKRAAAIILVVVLMGVGSWWVITQAHESRQPVQTRVSLPAPDANLRVEGPC